MCTFSEYLLLSKRIYVVPLTHPPSQRKDMAEARRKEKRGERTEGGGGSREKQKKEQGQEEKQTDTKP